MLVLGVFGACSSGPLMAATGVAALAVAMWRNLLGALLVAPVAVARRGDFAMVHRPERRQIWWAGVALAGHFATWTSSLRYTNVASAVALTCLQAAWVVVYLWWRGESVTRRVLTGLVLGLAGTLVVSGVDFAVDPRSLVGDGLAVLGGIFGAAYVLIGSRVRATTTTTAYTFACYGTAGGLLLVGCVVGRVDLLHYAASDWVKIVAVTVLAQIVGHSFINHVLATIGPTVVSLALLFETPGAALLAAVFLGQQPPVAVYAGIGLVLVGLAVVISERAEPAAEPALTAPS